MARVGIVGTGWGARVQVPMFREAGLHVVAIAGHDPDRTRSVARDLSLTPQDHWQQLIDRDDIDLVSVATPPDTHLQIAEAVMRSGKHLLCEKPMAISAEEAESMVRVAAEGSGRLRLIDHELRFLPAWRLAHEQPERVGNVRFVEMRYSSPSRGDRNRKWNWWSDVSRGGGVWGAIGSHLIDAVRYLAGEITAVQALLETMIDQRPYGEGWRPVTSDDFAAIHLRLANGGVAVMHCSVVSGIDEPTTITIHGDQGAIRLSGEKLLFSESGSPWKPLIDDETAARPGNSAGGAFGSGTLLLGRALREALDDGNLAPLAPAATLRDGLAHQRVLDAARRSQANGGRWEAVSPELG